MYIKIWDYIRRPIKLKQVLSYVHFIHFKISTLVFQYKSEKLRIINLFMRIIYLFSIRWNWPIKQNTVDLLGTE